MDSDDTTAPHPDALTVKAEAALSSGDLAAAASAYETLVARRPERVEPRFQLARVYEELGRLQDVIELLSHPSMAGLEQAKRRLVSVYMKGKNYSAAMPIIDELVAKYPDDEKLLKWQKHCDRKTSRSLNEQMERGQALVAAERLDDAEGVYLALLAEYPDVGRAYLHLGQIYLLQNRWADAIPTLRAGLAVQPGNIKIRRSLARGLFKNGEAAECLAILDTIERERSDANDLFLRQRCHAELGDWPNVQAVCSRVVDILSPDDPLRASVLDLNHRAQIEIKSAGVDAIAETGDTARAVAGYRNLTAEFPEWVPGWLKLGAALIDAGRDKEAIVALREALATHPAEMEIRKALTRAVIETSDETDILRHVEDAISSGMADFECYRWLARHHAEREEWAESLENAQRAVELDPAHPSARMLAVRALVHLRQWPEALEQLDLVLSQGAKQVEALQLKADIFVRFGRLEEAIALYQEALEAAPKDPLISYRLSSALLLTGDIEGYHRFHERRRELPGFTQNPRARSLQPWNGEISIEGKLLVWAEPGFDIGQTILHMTFLKQLTALGLDIVFEVEPALVDLCRRSFPEIMVVATDAQLPEGMSHHTPVASLSQWFKSDLASFDFMRPYLVPDVKAVAAHRARLREAAGDGQLLVGLAWSTISPAEPSEDPIPLDQLLDAVGLSGVTLVNLQGGDDSKVMTRAETTTGKRLVGSGIDNRDMDALAAVVAAMDLVVSVDHPAAHIAGGVGIPSYVLLPPVPAAHWLVEGERAIWYPATRLIRRTSRDEDWRRVLETAKNQVQEFLNGHSPDSWLSNTSVPGLQLMAHSAGTMSPKQIGDEVRAHAVQGKVGAELSTLDDLPIEVDPGAIEAAMRPFLVAEVDDRRRDQWHAKIWRHTVDRLVSGREANRDRGLIERDYAVWETMGFERYRLDRTDLQGTPWWWRDQSLSLDGAAAARLRTVLFSAVLDQVKPRRVLEVGSGNGMNLLSLAGAFPDIEFTGLELTPEGVEQARFAQSDSETAQILHPYSPLHVVDPSAIERIRFIQGDASSMPFEAGSFDLVMTVLAVEQMESIRAAALSEISRVASGHVLMLEPFRDMNEQGLRRLYVQSRGYFRGSIDELRNFGLEPLWATADFPQETFLGTALVLASKQGG